MNVYIRFPDNDASVNIDNSVGNIIIEYAS